MIGIVISEKDPAALGVKKQLLSLYDFKEKGEGFGRKAYEKGNFRILTISKEHLYFEKTPENMERVIFPSQHASKKGRNAFTCHFTGNWNSADYGGKEKSFSIADPFILKSIFSGISRLKSNKYDLSLECTHHGPTELKIPMCFVEIGCSKKAINDREAHKVIAKAIIESTPVKESVFCGFGGGHYPRKFTKLLLSKNISLGHLGPRYQQFDAINIKRAINKTPGCKGIIYDHKGLKSAQKKAVLKTAEKMDLKVFRLRDFD